MGEGFAQIKLKVGADLDDDRRLGVARAAVGEDIRIASTPTSAGTCPEAVTWVFALARLRFAWVEEPTTRRRPRHAAIAKGIAPVPVATGEH